MGTGRCPPWSRVQSLKVQQEVLFGENKVWPLEEWKAQSCWEAGKIKEKLKNQG